MKKISKAIVNRLAKNAGTFGIICGNVQTDMERPGVVIIGAYYGLAIVGDRPENTPDDNNADRAQGIYNNIVSAARMSCTKQLVTPDFKALQMYDRTERKFKTRRPFNWGAGMPAVNPQFLTDILNLDKSAKIYYSKPNAIIYIAGNGFEAVLMPIAKKKGAADIATDLTEYETEPQTAEPAQDVKPEAIKPWFLRADADANASPISWDEYTAAQTEPETEPEPEKSETRTSKTAEIVAYTADIAEIVEKYKRNGWKNPEFTRIAPNQYKLNGECPLVVNRQGDRLYYDIQAAPVKASNWFEKIKIVKVGA